MKCLVLAGGRGERLWPLSRRNFPKQFIKVQKNHSIFQETIARNLAFCDEFIVITNHEYRHIIANQMEAFHGVPYRCIFEEEPRKTTAAIALACLSLQPSEYVFVVAADHLIHSTEEGVDGKPGYKDAILKAKDYARENRFVIFGRPAQAFDERFGYFCGTDTVQEFYEKPDRWTIRNMGNPVGWFQNLGMLLFQNGFFLNELKRLQPEIFASCREVYAKREMLPEGVLYHRQVQSGIRPVSVEKGLLEHTGHLRGIEIGFAWSDVGRLEDLEMTGLVTAGVGVTHESAHSVIVNQSPHQAVVVNDLDNVLVVNTTDAVYVGRRGKSHLLKEILHDNGALMEAYADQGTVSYRAWGNYESLVEEEHYWIRRVTLLPGRTIYAHKHVERKENWTILQGRVLVTIDGEAAEHREGDNIDITPGMVHQISNVGEQAAVFIETAVGEVSQGGVRDIHGDEENGGTVTESELGIAHDALVKLQPAYKDYLWGGTRLRDVYGKQCDFDTIAESWELSAHPAGNSIIAAGKHKGFSFSRYLESVGKGVLGWKCSLLQAFPLLVKFIDAKQDLSVQVHPDDDYALSRENEYGKNEMWYVIDAEPGAGLYVGFCRDVDRDEVERRIADNTIMEVLNFFPTKAGDVFFIPAGTVHAIGAGNLICEIQQSSNCTYRLYDYDRRDKFGNPRELHLQKALEVLDYKKYVPGEFTVEQASGQKQIRCKYFETSVAEVNGREKIVLTDESFLSVVCIAGSGSLRLGEDAMPLQAGDSFFVPAADEVLQAEGRMSLILTRV
ncbi:MAG: cupin domain-containing protein [Lachnospiraceae bacterium]|nr:cupin domain-containing protein [Lachnospiraceae bacterium]